MTAYNENPRFGRRSAIRMVASVAFILLSAGAAWAQTCTVNIAPGATQSFSQASSGSATPPSTNLGQNGVQISSAGGIDNPAQNQMEADAFTGVGALSTNSASAQINYQFCVQSNFPNDNVSATISSEVYWNGILAGSAANLPGSNAVPSASVTMTLVDLGIGGSASPITVATATPLNTQLTPANIYSFTTTSGITLANISAGITAITGSQPAVLNVTVLTGHVYQIQYNLDCEAPTSGSLGYLVTCYFGSDLGSPQSYIPSLPSTPVCSGGCFSQVSSVSVTLGRDIFAEVEALRQAVAANNLTMEQENAQLLGILNEFLSLLSAKPADPPPAPTPGKGKTGYPKPPVRPVKPSANDPR